MNVSLSTITWKRLVRIENDFAKSISYHIFKVLGIKKKELSYQSDDRIRVQ